MRRSLKKDLGVVDREEWGTAPGISIRRAVDPAFSPSSVVSAFRRWKGK